MSWSIAAALLLSLVAALHSFLGERLLIGPLLDRMPKVRLSPVFARRVLRWAWHLTSVALWAMAVIVLRPERSMDVLAATMLFVALGLALGTRGAHFAWPLFAAVSVMIGLAAHGPAFVADAQRPAALALAGVLSLLAALHVYWAAGGRTGWSSAVPSEGGAPVFVPGPLACIAVALALLGFGASVLAAAEVVTLPGSSSMYRIVVALGGAVFALRAVGDRRYCGFFKRKLGTMFAKRDTAFYTPLCVLLGFASFTVAL